MTPALQQDNLEQLEGVVERITFYAPDTGWTVMRLEAATSDEIVTAVGVMLDPEIGESVRLFGNWDKHPRFGQQFRFSQYQLFRPATARAIEAYLGGGLVDGVGPKLAATLVKHFGDKTLDVLDKSPERLREAAGIGAKRAAALRDAWRRHQAIHRVMVFLHQHGVGSALAARIYSLYGDRSMEILERTPYRLARDVRGIGFLTADRIARSVGVAEDDPARIAAGLMHVLHAASEDGHLYLPHEILLEKTQNLLGLSEQLVKMRIEHLEQAEELTLERRGNDTDVWDPAMLRVEQEVCARLLDASHCDLTGTPDRDQIKAWLTRRQLAGDTTLSEEQVTALCGALQCGLCVITGGPGTGKTTVTRSLVDAFKSLRKQVALASPTGRAAKRLAQVTGHDATTIHRLLSYDPMKRAFRYGVEQLLEADVVVVDEASMLDIILARDLLRAIAPRTQLILVGDADQLPSVGPGNLMRDVVASNTVPVFRLNEVFRQGAGSDIVRSAHLLNRGESPQFPSRGEWLRQRGDCVLLEEEEIESAVDRVIYTVTESLPKLGFPASQVQVITPLHRGPLGVQALNHHLQEALNPPAETKSEARRGETSFRISDRVLQVMNNYDRGVFNGDIGFICDILPKDRMLTVEFDQGRVDYEFSSLDELELAYALTVHKSQGSEYPAVVLVIHSTHYIMLQRNLLYTALTRAQQMACIVGNQRGIWRAINNISVQDRFTRLRERLGDKV